MKRLFIAIKIEQSKPLIEIFGKIKKELAEEKVKWVDPENLHLTLVFLGNTQDEFIPKIKPLIDDISYKYSQFNMTLSSFGVFKNIQNPTVFWFGIEKNNVLSEINKELYSKLTELGLLIEMRDFKPHLTIGRSKIINEKVKLKDLIDELRDKIITNQKVENIILYESILTPGGPIYKALHKSFLK